MTTKTREPIPAEFFFQSARRAYAVADEMRQMAEKKELKDLGHECGHQFTITVSSVGHYGIADEGPESHKDAIPFEDDDIFVPVTVRAHNLADALRKAATLPLSAWMAEEYCACTEGPYIGTQPAGEPVRCERCGGLVHRDG